MGDKHSAGPWTLERHSNRSIAGWDVWGKCPDGYTVMVASLSELDDEQPASVIDANARLIASAPEMLAEIEKFCARVEAGEIRSTRTYAAFKALIAKARGQ